MVNLESKGGYCPCNRCMSACQEGRQEVASKIKKIAKAYDTSGDQILWRVGQDLHKALNDISES